MKFRMQHLFFPSDVKEFDETNAPKWLSKGGPAGSTMDNRWFWEGFALKLEVGKSIKTDFHEITRIS